MTLRRRCQVFAEGQSGLPMPLSRQAGGPRDHALPSEAAISASRTHTRRGQRERPWRGASRQDGVESFRKSYLPRVSTKSNAGSSASP